MNRYGVFSATLCYIPHSTCSCYDGQVVCVEQPGAVVSASGKQPERKYLSGFYKESKKIKG